MVTDLLAVKQGEQYDTKEVKHVFKMLGFWNQHNFNPADPLTDQFYQEEAGYKVVSVKKVIELETAAKIAKEKEALQRNERNKLEKIQTRLAAGFAKDEGLKAYLDEFGGTTKDYQEHTRKLALQAKLLGIMQRHPNVFRLHSFMRDLKKKRIDQFELGKLRKGRTKTGDEERIAAQSVDKFYIKGNSSKTRGNSTDK